MAAPPSPGYFVLTTDAVQTGGCRLSHCPLPEGGLQHPPPERRGGRARAWLLPEIWGSGRLPGGAELNRRAVPRGRTGKGGAPLKERGLGMGQSTAKSAAPPGTQRCSAGGGASSGRCQRWAVPAVGGAPPGAVPAVGGPISGRCSTGGGSPPGAVPAVGAAGGGPGAGREVAAFEAWRHGGRGAGGGGREAVPRVSGGTGCCGED